MPTYERSYGAFGEYSLPSAVEEEAIGMKDVMSRRAGAYRRLLKLGASVGALAFVSAYTGSHYLASSSSPSSAHEQLEVAPTIDVVSTSALAGACSDASTIQAPPSACFDGATQSFKREWLLWKGRPMRDVSLIAALNTNELSVALHRFDDVEPLSMATGNNHAASKKEKTATLESTKEAQQEKAENKESGGAAKTGSDAPETTDGMPEGGRKRSRTRRLAEASTSNNDDDDNHNIGDDANDVSTPAFTITVGNAYTAKSGGYSTEYPWRYMAEPFRATTLAVEAPLSGASYRWTVDGHVHGYGSSISALFQQIGYHTVTVERRLTGDEEDSTETAPGSVTANVMCKYVRREVRSLTDADREAWLSAVQVLQHVPTAAGQELYGTNYYSKDHFTRLHLYYGGTLDCDHWHQGAGFVTSHVALTLMWEQALQSVNPSIAAPYWDFTLESTFYGSSDWSTSFVFADDWFGAANPTNDLHTPDTGRFAFVATLADASEYTEWVNSYGLMRAPWNSDPTPFLTRSGSVYGYHNNMKPSGCDTYAAAVKKTSWMSLSKVLNAAAHGHIHELMGGSWHHYFQTANQGASSPAVYTFAHQIQAMSKMLWRDGYVTCPETCDMTTPADECQCQANLDKLGTKPSGQVLQEVGILSAVEFFDEGFHTLSSEHFLDDEGNYKPVLDGYTELESTHVYNRLLGMLANPGHLGDMYQATSSNDITFWTIHLTVDRLWHYKRLGNLANYDETWDPYHTCYGHNPRDVQPFMNLFGETHAGAYAANVTVSSGNSDKSSSSSSADVEGLLPADRRRLDASEITGGDGVSGKAPAQKASDSSSLSSTSTANTYYTNMELYTLLHPMSQKLQYVYDNFNWPHCDQMGREISNLW